MNEHNETMNQMVDNDRARRVAEDRASEVRRLVRVAYSDLRADKIAARANFTCCGTCGAAELHAEEKRRREEGREPRIGYAFYHRQDADALTEHPRKGHPQVLYFSFGAFDDHDDAAFDVARKLAAALRGAGLDVVWPHDVTKRVGVLVSTACTVRIPSLR